MTSPYLRISSERAQVSSAAEFRARRIYNAAVAKFRSELQDAAALSPAYGTQLLRLLSLIDEHTTPTIPQWDKAINIKPRGV
jgi:hypothetical protein